MISAAVLGCRCGASSTGAANHPAGPQQSAPRKVHPQPCRLEQYPADLSHLVGDEASDREDPIVEICVGVADAPGVHGLMRRLGGVFDRSSVSFDGARVEVRVRSERESREVVQVLGAVEAWLAEDGRDYAELSIGDRSYTMVAPAPIGSNL
jgi:hypothetical protein